MLHSAPARFASNPLVAWATFFGVLWLAHFTGLYEAALRNNGLHALEHITFLLAALMFWAPIVRADPSPSVLSYPARILYLFVAMPAMALLGLTIVSARDVLYPTYAQAEGVARALADQGTAGAIMWAGTMFLIVPALGLVLWEWMAADEREARRMDAQLDRATIGPMKGAQMSTKGRCLRCRGPVMDGVAICARCNPAGLPSPSPTQYHATVFLVVIVTMVLAVGLLIARG